MKLPTIDRKYVAIAVAALAGLMFLDVVYQIQMHVRWRLWLPSSLAVDGAATTRPTTAKPPMPGGMPQLSASIKRRNIFLEPAPRGHGISLSGVMGKFALFAGRSGPFCCEEGKSSNGITVKSIKDYEVTIEYQGKPETMRLSFGQAGPNPMPGSMGPGGRMPPTLQPAAGMGPGMPMSSGPISEDQLRRIRELRKSRSIISLDRNSSQCTTAP